MTRNRTAIDVLSAAGTELMVLLLLVLAGVLTAARYLSSARERMRRVELKLLRRSSRGIAA